VEEQLAYLKNMRLIFENVRPGLYNARREVLRQLSPQKTKYLEEQTVHYIKEHIHQFIPWRVAHSFKLLADFREHDAIIDHLPQVIQFFLDSRNFKQAEFFLSPGHYINFKTLSAEKQKRLEYICHSYTIRFYLLQGETLAARKQVEHSVLPTESLMPDPVFARFYLELGRYHLSEQNVQKAIPLLKKAMHYFQELNMTSPTSESFLELGCGFLAKGNLKEALDYFSFSKKLIQDLSSPLIHARSLWFECITLYLQGNYSRIMANCDEASLLVRSHGLRETERLFTFMKGRALFDLGFYERAAGRFQECLCIARIYGQPQAQTTLYAWIARSTCYLGHTKDALALLRSLPETQEVLFFRGEAFYFAKEEKKAEKTFVKALHVKSAPPDLFPEHMTWENGYAMIEGRCLTLSGHGSPLSRLIRTFRAFLQCRGGKLEEGIAELHTLTITDKFSPADPHVYLFYFLYYLVLKTLEKNTTVFKEIGHGVTILNKALKHLQERSTTIDEARDRINYITQNYWNKFIFAEGKINKLI
jgi:tetratricopeptide (TPR) repeat protein